MIKDVVGIVGAVMAMDKWTIDEVDGVDLVDEVDKTFVHCSLILLDHDAAGKGVPKSFACRGDEPKVISISSGSIRSLHLD